MNTVFYGEKAILSHAKRIKQKACVTKELRPFYRLPPKTIVWNKSAPHKGVRGPDLILRLMCLKFV